MVENSAVVDFTASIKEKCADFIGGQWITNNDAIKITKIETGFANQTFRCTLEEHDENEPKDLIIRFYGSGIVGEGSTFKINGEAGEAIVFQILSEHDLAPKLLGVFNGGRIEEFIEGRNITVEDFNEIPNFFETIAKKVARYHTLEMPISKQPKLFEHLQYFFTNHSLQKSLDSFTPENQKYITSLFEFPVLDEFNWFVQNIPKFNSKVVFAHNDLYADNIIVKNKYNSTDDRLIVIDFDICSYFYRGFDIAFFVLSNEYRLINRKDDLKVEFLNSRDIEAIKTQFIKDYLNELSNFGVELDDDLDSFEHLLMEVNCFSLQVYLTNISFTAAVVNNVEKCASFSFISDLLNSYKKMKNFVLTTYPQNFN